MKPFSVAGGSSSPAGQSSVSTVQPASSGPGKRTLWIVVGLVILVLVIALFTFVLLQKKGAVAGQAVKFQQAQAGQAGIFFEYFTKALVGETFSAPVQVDLGKTSSSTVHLKLVYDPTLFTVTCDHLFDPLDAIFKGKDAEGKEFDLAMQRDLVQCGNGVVEFNYAALPQGDKVLTGVKTIALLDVVALKEAKVAKLEVTELTMYDLASTKLISLKLYNDQIAISPDTGCAVEAPFKNAEGQIITKFVDKDSLCATGQSCKKGKCVEALCADGVDNDNNKKIDCQDNACMASSSCFLRDCGADSVCGEGWKCVAEACYPLASQPNEFLSCEQKGFDLTTSLKGSTDVLCGKTEVCTPLSPFDYDGDGLFGCEDANCEENVLCAACTIKKEDSCTNEKIFTSLSSSCSADTKVVLKEDCSLLIGPKGGQQMTCGYTLDTNEVACVELCDDVAVMCPSGTKCFLAEGSPLHGKCLAVQEEVKPAVEPGLTSGQTCTKTEECQKGLTCALPNYNTADGSQKCLGGEGYTCDLDTQCVKGLSCVSGKCAVKEEPKVVSIVYGDVDGVDGVTSTDALKVLQAVVGKIILTADQTKAGDVDCESGLSSTDALKILQKVVAKITKFPVEEGCKA